MAITYKEVINLIKLTMIDCPLPPVADILAAIGPDDSEARTMLDFLKSHYTRKQLREGIDEYLKRIEFMQQLYGRKK